MNYSPLMAVVDASVGIKLCVEEELSNEADTLFAYLTVYPPAQLYVPDLFLLECANVLWKYVRRVGYPPDKAREDLVNLSQLTLRRVPTTELLSAALDISLTYGTTVYDGCYVALSERLAIPCVTADKKLVNIFANHPVFHVYWLGDFLKSD